MVNRRNISAGESSWRISVLVKSSSLNHFHNYVVHMLTLGLTQLIALAKHLRGLLNILITHNDCIPKCCEVVTTLHEQLVQVKGLWFDTHIVIMTIFSQPQFKPWPRFVAQSFIFQLVFSWGMVHVVGVDTQSDIGGVGFIHTCLSS